MTDKTFTVQKQFLVALANRVFKHGRGLLTFRSPLIEKPLLKVDREFKTREVIDHDAFASSRKVAVHGDPAANEEMPIWKDFTLALQASGAIKPRNWEAFLEWLSGVEKDSKSPEHVTNPVAIAIDTNVAYNRLFSRHLDPAWGPARDFTILCSQGVIGEIDCHIGGKVGREELRRLYLAPRHEPYLDQLANRNSLETRRAKLAQNEIDYLKKEHRAVPTPCGAYQGDKEAFDAEIARSYASSVHDRALSAYMITFDQNMGDHAKNAGLPRFILEPPDEKLFSGASLELALPALIHDMAVLFGVLVMEPFGIHIWGEWAGKTSADYEAERVRIEMESKTPIVDLLSRDVEIGQALFKEMAKWPQ